MADFADYLRAQEAVSLAWTDRMHWNRMSLLNTARTGFFSSDRSIGEYCKNIWNVGSPQRRNHLRRALMGDLCPGYQSRQFQPQGGPGGFHRGHALAQRTQCGCG